MAYSPWWRQGENQGKHSDTSKLIQENTKVKKTDDTQGKMQTRAEKFWVQRQSGTETESNYTEFNLHSLNWGQFWPRFWVAALEPNFSLMVCCLPRGRQEGMRPLTGQSAAFDRSNEFLACQTFFVGWLNSLAWWTPGEKPIPEIQGCSHDRACKRKAALENTHM